MRRLGAYLFYEMQWSVEGRGMGSVDVRIVREAFADWVVGDVSKLILIVVCVGEAVRMVSTVMANVSGLIRTRGPR